MMDRGQFAHFSAMMLLIFSSCASGSIEGTTQTKPVSVLEKVQESAREINMRTVDPSAADSDKSAEVIESSQLNRKLELTDANPIELSSKIVVPGTIVFVAVKVPGATSGAAKGGKDAAPVVTGIFEGSTFPFFEQSSLGDGVQGAILGVPYDHKPGLGFVKVRVGSDPAKPVAEFETSFTVVKGNYPSEVLRVDGRKVNPTHPKVLKRIIKEQAQVAEIYHRITQRKYWTGPFILPIPSKTTSPFGTRRIYNGRLKNFHPGMDLKAAMLTPIRSPAPGEVVMAKNLFYTGNTVIIDHGYGLITLYGHMTRLNVKPGQKVNTRDLLGLSGKTGRVNGPHLHWQAVVHGVKINPVGLTNTIM